MGRWWWLFNMECVSSINLLFYFTGELNDEIGFFPANRTKVYSEDQQVIGNVRYYLRSKNKLTCSRFSQSKCRDMIHISWYSNMYILMVQRIESIYIIYDFIWFHNQSTSNNSSTSTRRSRSRSSTQPCCWRVQCTYILGTIDCIKQ